MDFSNVQGSTDLINNWVADVTNGLLTNFVQKETVLDAVVLLVNAIFFEGHWRVPFKPEKTAKGDFFQWTK